MNALHCNVALLGLLLASTACSSTVNQDDDGVGGDGQSSVTSASVTGSTNDGAGPSSASSGGPVEEPPQGLFDCQDLQLSCASVSFHIYPDPPEGWECIARLALAGEPGIVRGAWTPGPFYTVSEHLVVYRGDGKAITQARNKSCGAPGDVMCPEPGPLPWGEPGKVQLCDVVVSDQVETACNDDVQGCGAMPDDTITNCVEIPEPTCAEIAAIGAPAE